MQIVYGEVPYAVMMITPADVADFAIGFSLTEGIIEHFDEIRVIAISEIKGGLQAKMTLAPNRMSQHLSRKRAMSGRTGCGICGIDDIRELETAIARIPSSPVISMGAVERAILALDHHQPLNDETRAVHAAAWFTCSGDFVVAREDVGRHNALDKLIGALLADHAKPQDGFVVITSRCSFEMVEKTARFGASLLVSVSAPTSLALERASALGVRVIAVARQDGAILFDPQTAQKNQTASQNKVKTEGAL